MDEQHIQRRGLYQLLENGRHIWHPRKHINYISETKKEDQEENEQSNIQQHQSS